MNKKRLKLNVLSQRELNLVKGGQKVEPGVPVVTCVCACRYENNGGSSSADNGVANDAGGLGLQTTVQ